MLARLISVRLFAALLFAVPVVTVPALRAAQAQEKEDETEEAGGEEGDASKPDLNQPSVTAGGNYTIANYPLSEVERTLLIPAGGIEAQLRYDADLSKEIAFKTNTLTIMARYGATPMVEVKAAFAIDATAPDGVEKDKALAVAVEAAILYDLLDVQAGANINFTSSDHTAFDVFVGLPFKYRITNQIALLGLEDILTIHTNVPDGASSTPDLQLSVAGMYAPLPALSVWLRATLLLANASADTRSLPVELTAQYALSPQFDIGLGLTLKNIAPPTKTVTMVSITPGLFDGRALHLFVQGRL